jgi:hypothetical protein
MKDYMVFFKNVYQGCYQATCGSAAFIAWAKDYGTTVNETVDKFGAHLSCKPR